MRKTKTRTNVKVSARKAGRNRQRRRQRPSKRIFRTNAPIAVSDDLQQYVRFLPGDRGSSLQLTAVVPLVQLAQGVTGNEGSFYRSAGWDSGSVTNVPVLMMSSVGLTDQANNPFDYLSPVWKLIGSAFVRYRCLGLEFIYEPQSPTTTTDRMVFAFAEDPIHPLINTSSPSQDKLLALSDSVAFAPWRSWSLDVSDSVRQDLLYTAQFTNTSEGALLRLQNLGCIGCMPSTLAASNPTVNGILYFRMHLEFVEFCPVVQDFTAVLSKKQKKPVTTSSSDDEDSERCTLEKCPKHSPK